MSLRGIGAAFVIHLAVSAAFGQDTVEGVERIVAIGDVHGDYDRLIDLLRVAKLIDGRNAWIGGKSHLVLPGDFIDRGNDSRKVMDLLMDLEPQAASAGGQVHALLGNHEAMNLYGDLRYVTKGDYDSFRGPNSSELRDRAFHQALQELKEKGASPPDQAAFRRTFDAEHPLGWVEHRAAFASSGKYGKWLQEKRAIIRINDMIFLHGGISPKYALASRAEINKRVREELRDFTKLPDGIVMDLEGPLWYRGLVDRPDTEAGLAAHVNQVLKTQQARHIVVGHTVVIAVIPRFAGKVIAIDVGLSKVFGGPPAFLLVEKSKFYAMHRAHRLDLPVESGSVAQYLRAASEIDPANSQLRKALKKTK